jgi:sec-independent protein translocase protein TatC
MVNPSKQDEDELEESKAPLLEHLVELRKRIVYSLYALFLTFIVCFYFSKDIYNFLTQPLADAFAGQSDRRMIFTALYEAFFTQVKVALWGGLCVAFPFMAYQLWRFIAPGLYKHERKAFWPFLIATPFMFILGASFVYYVMLPRAIRFFLGYENQGGNGTIPIELQARVGEYLDFVTTLIFAFGFCFELPVLLMLLGRVGIVTSKGLASFRRYAVVAVFAVAAIVTPPDVFSQLSLAVPLVGLYEVSIWGVWMIERDRAKKEAAGAGAEGRPAE